MQAISKHTQVLICYFMITLHGSDMGVVGFKASQCLQMSLTEGKIPITLLRLITTRFTDAASRRSSSVPASVIWLCTALTRAAYRGGVSLRHALSTTLDHPCRSCAGISRSVNTPQGRDSRLDQGSSVAESYGSPLNGVMVLALALAREKVSQTT